ncbi:hypothetical protein [Streptomyces atratus]|uniref:Uncharacterized protein n=1 Tax=Streptomyces atratus TaxID=1893 RepID=A0A1K2A387_STRAR|nr:hypothetical protein SAMN02787144_1006254 [Streptomyces atratus]
MDQRWRVRWNDPANWRDLQFVAIAPFTMGVVASLRTLARGSAGRPTPLGSKEFASAQTWKCHRVARAVVTVAL